MQKAFSTIRMAAREENYFGLGYTLGQYLLKALRMAGLLLIWHMLYEGGAAMEGMTLPQALKYTLLSAALLPMLDVRTKASSFLHDGAVVQLYLRPMGVFSQLMCQSIGSWRGHLLLLALPILLVSPLFGLSLWPASPWALLSLLLCISLGFCVDLFFACLIIRLRNMSYQVEALRGALSALLSGAVIPFAALPFGIGRYLALTPLGSLAGAPLSIWVGLSSPMELLPAQILWNLVLWPLGVWCFRLSRERMVSYGG